MGLFSGSKSKSSTSQKAEQQTTTANGFQSIATGRQSDVYSNIFGDKNLAKNDYTETIVAAGVVLIVGGIIFKRVRQ